MNRQLTVTVEGKAYDITISEAAFGAIEGAIASLKASGENIGAKRLLEAYLTQAARAKTLEGELRAIGGEIDKANII